MPLPNRPVMMYDGGKAQSEHWPKESLEEILMQCCSPEHRILMGKPPLVRVNTKSARVFSSESPAWCEAIGVHVHGNEQTARSMSSLFNAGK